MANRHEKLIAWILKKLEEEPLTTRIELLRATAEAIGNEPEARELIQIALDMARADLRCREFSFRFNNPKPENPKSGDGEGDGR